MSIYKPRVSDLCRRLIYAGVVSSGCYFSSVLAAEESFFDRLLSTDRFDAGLVHQRRFDREGADISRSTSLGFARLRLSNGFDEARGIAVYKSSSPGLDLKFGAPTFKPELAVFLGQSDQADGVVAADFGFQFPFWNLNHDVLPVGGCNSSGKKCETAIVGYNSDFPSMLNINVIPGVVYSEGLPGADDSTDFHAQISGDLHFWLRKPRDNDSSFWDVKFSYGNDWLFYDDSDADGEERFVSMLMRASPSDSVELSLNMYAGKREFDKGGLTDETAISKEFEIKINWGDDVLGKNVGLFTSLSVGNQKLLDQGGTAGRKASYYFASPMIYVRYPSEKKRVAPMPLNLVDSGSDGKNNTKVFTNVGIKSVGGFGGFWSSGAGGVCFSNPACRLAVFGY